MAIKYYTITHLKEIGTIELWYCTSKLMVADILTKQEAKPYF